MNLSYPVPELCALRRVSLSLIFILDISSSIKWGSRHCVGSGLSGELFVGSHTNRAFLAWKPGNQDPGWGRVGWAMQKEALFYLFLLESP